MKRIIALLVIALLGLLFAGSASASSKVTICHAAGRAGTTHYVTLTLSEHALRGHFDNKGTPLAGHEDDYLGACKTATNTATPTPTPTPTKTKHADVGLIPPLTIYKTTDSLSRPPSRVRLAHTGTGGPLPYIGAGLLLLGVALMRTSRGH